MKRSIQEIADLFKALSDRTRLRIIYVLVRAGSKLCVCEIMDALGESQYLVSRHLKVLRVAGLVDEEKEGRWVFYSLTPAENRFRKLIVQAISSLPEDLLADDSKRLKKRLALRKEGKCVIGMKSKE